MVWVGVRVRVVGFRVGLAELPFHSAGTTCGPNSYLLISVVDPIHRYIQLEKMSFEKFRSHR